MRLEDVLPGAQILGIAGSGPVTVVAATWIGGNALRLVYRTDAGNLDERLLYRDHEPRLDLSRQGAAFDLSADGAKFKLAAEALRIRMAGRFDPMLAVHTSDLEPLPHQIQAVYGELIQRTPLRFLLADDPGAGKTIMAGLYIKELMLRGDLERCLIVAPGGLVEQWQDELREKFGLTFELLTRQLADAEPDGNVFARHNLLIARMDQLSRSDEFKEQLERADWDLVVVDEAHRMSAHYFGNELKKTKRYQLGELLGKTTRHFLLMTATPHAGREEDFQLFLALLDTDRFEGRYRDAVHTVNTEGLMRRMVKEDLKTFEGKPLFPERRAYTVAYELSEAEQDLYEAVTQYVREEMTNADKLKEAGDFKRGATVGFALTVLQRRLASSPEAILKSLERRHKRLEKRRNELRYGNIASEDQNLAERLRDLLGKDPTESDLTDFGSDGDDLPGGEAEDAEAEIADAATAARTIAELDKELAILADLTELARRVRHLGTDKKWTELRGILTGTMLTSATGLRPTWRQPALPSPTPTACSLGSVNTSPARAPWPERASCRPCFPTALSRRTRRRRPQDHHLHRAPRHPGVPGRTHPRPARPLRRRRHHPRRRPARGTPPGHRAVHPGHRHPGTGRHRRRRRGPQPAARAPHGQLRPAVEPEPDRAAIRPHPPHRPDRGLPPVEPGRRRHPRGHGLPPAAHQDRGAAQGLPRQGLRRARRGVRGPAAQATCSSRRSATATAPRSAPGSTRSSTRPSARAWTSSSPNAPRTPTSSPSPTWRSGVPGWTRRTVSASSRTTSAPSSGGVQAARRPDGRTRVRPLRDPARPRRHPRPRPPDRHQRRAGAQPSTSGSRSPRS